MIEEWKELSRKTLLKKYGRGLDEVVFLCPDGKEREFILKNEGDPVCVLALTEEHNVILVRQFRPGPGKVLIDLPGGGRDEGETPMQAAERELLEETGYRGQMQFLTRSYECGYSPMHRYCYVATKCKKVADPHLDDGEFVETIEMNLYDFRKLLRSGEMTDVEVGYLGLDYLGLL